MTAIIKNPILLQYNLRFVLYKRSNFKLYYFFLTVFMLPILTDQMNRFVWFLKLEHKLSDIVRLFIQRQSRHLLKMSILDLGKQSKFLDVFKNKQLTYFAIFKSFMIPSIQFYSVISVLRPSKKTYGFLVVF